MLRYIHSIHIPLIKRHIFYHKAWFVFFIQTLSRHRPNEMIHIGMVRWSGFIYPDFRARDKHNHLQSTFITNDIYITNYFLLQTNNNYFRNIYGSIMFISSLVTNKHFIIMIHTFSLDGTIPTQKVWIFFYND